MKSDPGDAPIIGCSPVDEGPSNIKKSTQGTCRKCGTGVWLAPSTRYMMSMDPGLVTWCMRCVLAQVEADGDENLKVRLHTHQRGELLAYFTGRERRN